MGYRLNCLDEPVIMAVSKPMQTEFGIHHRLESCEYYFTAWVMGPSSQPGKQIIIMRKILVARGKIVLFSGSHTYGMKIENVNKINNKICYKYTFSNGETKARHKGKGTGSGNPFCFAWLLCSELRCCQSKTHFMPEEKKGFDCKSTMRHHGKWCKI